MNNDRRLGTTPAAIVETVEVVVITILVGVLMWYTAAVAGPHPTGI